MTERRMISKKIIDSDAFTKMPLSSQALHFHLLLRADDDELLDNARRIMRSVDANQDDYDMLPMKRFLIQFKDGICVIKHWKIHNYIQEDRYKPTLYIDELSLLTQRENGTYSLITDCEQPGNNLDTKCIQINSTISALDARVRLGKDRISIDKDIIMSDGTICRTDIQRVVEAWGQLGVNPVSRMASTSTRYKMIFARIKEYGVDDILGTIEKISENIFLKGGGSRGWVTDFEWFSRPNNFPKILESQYDGKKSSSSSWEGRLNG